ncbi:hypothetical protein R1flu_005756 [Riccia fluitans]|uniref:Uncharacterized protein n=1 Tax=Riccia fluitans TaxID=41844 RepID=A0ABD1YU30_9MARC
MTNSGRNTRDVTILPSINLGNISHNSVVLIAMRAALIRNIELTREDDSDIRGRQTINYYDRQRNRDPVEADFLVQSNSIAVCNAMPGGPGACRAHNHEMLKRQHRDNTEKLRSHAMWEEWWTTHRPP